MNYRIFLLMTACGCSLMLSGQPEIIDGERWYRLTKFWVNYDESRQALYTNRTDGLYERIIGDTTAPILIAKYPALTHEKFSDASVTYSSLSYSAYYVECDTVDLPIALASKLYRTNRYTLESGRRSGDVISWAAIPSRFYSPGVGPVQLGFFANDGRTASASQTIWQLDHVELR